MTYVLIAVAAVLVVILVSGALLRKRRPATATATNESSTSGAQVATKDRPTLPDAGVLMAESVLPEGASQVSIWDALENAAVPVAVSYRSVSSTELARYKAVPLNTGAQDVMKGLAKFVNPKEPTLYEVVLPKGAKLVRPLARLASGGSRVMPRASKLKPSSSLRVLPQRLGSAGPRWLWPER